MAKKILIIEDDEFLGNAILDKLRKEGYEAVISHDGSDGFKMISSFMPDLVLLDMMLPATDGYEILEAKKNTESIKSIPVIVISNSGQEVEIKKIKDLGAIDYIVKVQFSPSDVVEKIDKILNNGSEKKKGFEIEPVATKSAISGKSRLTGVKIMIVEDDAFLGDLLTKKLTNEGAEITRMQNGEDALAELKNIVPDLITLDIVLPGISGLDTLKEIRRDDRLKKVPTIILSNLSQKEDAVKAMSLGASEFLVKSLFTLEEVVEKIKGVIAKHKI